MMTATSPTAPAPSLEAARHAMVASQLRTSAVTDSRIVAAMASLPREAYLPAAQAPFAYLDRTVPLGGGRYQNNPLATARLLTAAQLRAADRVLLIGASGGYTAAVLAALVAEVVAVESDARLAANARAALGDLGNVSLVEGGLAAGAAEHAPYDVLIVDGAVEALPDALVAQVREGGRVTAGLVDRGVTRLASGTRTAGGFGLVDFADLDCAILPGFDRPRGFVFAA